MEDMKDYTNEEITKAREFRARNLETFKKKFLFFFIGLCAFALGIVINAFGAMGVGVVLLFAGMAAWSAPLIIKFWVSGWGALFDFRYEVYEIYSDGTKKNVTTVGDMMVGPLVKFFVTILIVIVSLYLVPAEIIVRFLNHRRAEKKLGEKGTIKDAPRRELLLSVLVIVAMIVVGAIGGAITNKKENTSDISDTEIVTLIETLEEKSKSYTILDVYNYGNNSNTTLATVTETNGTVVFKLANSIMWTREYTLPANTYTYTNGAWDTDDENAKQVLSILTLGVALDFDELKANLGEIVVNKDSGLSGRIDTDEHGYYQVKAKDNSSFEFEDFYIEENWAFVTWSLYNYVYVFN